MPDGAWTTALLIDLASIEAFEMQSGTRVDYLRLLERFRTDLPFLRAAAYAVVDDNRPDGGPDPRYTAMARHGYKVTTKALRRREDGSMRGNVLVEMTVDALELAPHIHSLTIITTDVDLVPLVEAVQRQGVRVQLITARDARTDSLLDTADDVLTLEEFLPSLQRDAPGSRSGTRRPVQARRERPTTAQRASAQSDSAPKPKPVSEASISTPDKTTPSQQKPDQSEQKPDQSEQKPDRSEDDRATQLRRLPQERLSGRSAPQTASEVS